MRKKSVEILKNLGLSDDLISELKQEKNLKNILVYLKDIELPSLAIRQIKAAETPPKSAKQTTNTEISNQQLIEMLVQKCSKAFTSFAKKKTKAIIAFNGAAGQKTWKMFCKEYTKPLQKLHEACKDHFDELANQGLIAYVIFNGTERWAVSENIVEDEES